MAEFTSTKKRTNNPSSQHCSTLSQQKLDKGFMKNETQKNAVLLHFFRS